MTTLRPFEVSDLVVAAGRRWQDVIRYFPPKPVVNILVVVDGSVSLGGSFGVPRAVSLIRANVDAYVTFDVDQAILGVQGSVVAENPAPGAQEARFTNFRFDSVLNGQTIIATYDEIWCFGWAPGNNAGGVDADIANDPHRLTNSDLAVLSAWMNAGGGMLAMGDHHYLGAAMCSEIPRVRSMRAWTLAQQVPPIGGFARHDTNRPQNASQDAAFTPTPAVIPGSAETDGVPQPIEWRRYPVAPGFAYFRNVRPHPVLCDGKLGVLDVLPDHPHEGNIFERWQIDLDATYSFSDAGQFDEYPSSGDIRPEPEVIAWANTLGDPPYVHAKGDTPKRRFGVIGAYDGDAAGPGRVLVDATWHHWFDMNINGLEAESPNDEFDKIARYFRNCAVWLARKDQRQAMLKRALFWLVFDAEVFEDLSRGVSKPFLGGRAIDVLGRWTSECLVRELIDIVIPERLEWRLKDPRPNPCWSCPPIDIVREYVLGAVIEELIPIRDAVLVPGPRRPSVSRVQRELDGAFRRGVEGGLAEFSERNRENLRGLEELAELLK